MKRAITQVAASHFSLLFISTTKKMNETEGQIYRAAWHRTDHPEHTSRGFLGRYVHVCPSSDHTEHAEGGPGQHEAVPQTALLALSSPSSLVPKPLLRLLPKGDGIRTQQEEFLFPQSSEKPDDLRGSCEESPRHFHEAGRLQCIASSGKN